VQPNPLHNIELETDMDKAALIKLAISAGVIYAVYRFAPNAAVKAAALGVAGVLVVKNTPVVNQYVAI
jgi:hypothetical protein